MTGKKNAPGPQRVPGDAFLGPSGHVRLLRRKTETGMAETAMPVAACRIAFPSLPSADGKPNSIIFCQGVYLVKNTSQAESVRAGGLAPASARFSLRSPPNGSPAKRVPFGAPAWRRPPCRLVFIVLHSPCRSSRWIRGPTGRRIPPWSPGPRPCCRSTDSPRSRCLRRGPSERGGRRRSPCR